MIKREIPYSAVQSFYIDNEDKEKLYINFMNKGNKKSHVYKAKKIEDFRDALLDAINRFKFFVTSDIDLFKKSKLDVPVDKFFECVKTQSNFDTKKFKNVLKPNDPAKELKKVFLKLLIPIQNMVELT